MMTLIANKETEVWFRYEDFIMGDNAVIVQRRTFPVSHYTPKGVQLDIGLGKLRLVLHKSNKKFAHATDTEARESFKARKRAQMWILKRQLSVAETAIKAIDSDTLDTFLGIKHKAYFL